MTTIEAQWQEFRQTPFPKDMHGNTIAGINPTELNAVIAACMDAYTSGAGIAKADVQKHLAALQILNPNLTGDAQVYFGKLYRLLDLVNEHISND